MRWDLTLAAGAGLGALVWFAAGPKTLSLDKAARFERPASAAPARDGVDRLTARLEHVEGLQLFPAAVVAASGAPAPVAGNMKLRGTAISPGRRAALISIDGGPARWVAAGEAGDLELLELSDTRAVLRTSAGQVVALDLFKPPEGEPTETNGGND